MIGLGGTVLVWCGVTAELDEVWGRELNCSQSE